MDAQYLETIEAFYDGNLIGNYDVWKKNWSSGTKLNIKYYLIDSIENSVLCIISKEFYRQKIMDIYESESLKKDSNNILKDYISKIAG